MAVADLICKEQIEVACVYLSIPALGPAHLAMQPALPLPCNVMAATLRAGLPGHTTLTQQ